MSTSLGSLWISVPFWGFSLKFRNLGFLRCNANLFLKDFDLLLDSFEFFWLSLLDFLLLLRYFWYYFINLFVNILFLCIPSRIDSLIGYIWDNYSLFLRGRRPLWDSYALLRFFVGFFPLSGRPRFFFGAGRGLFFNLLCLLLNTLRCFCNNQSLIVFSWSVLFINLWKLVLFSRLAYDVFSWSWIQGFFLSIILVECKFCIIVWRGSNMSRLNIFTYLLGLLRIDHYWSFFGLYFFVQICLIFFLNFLFKIIFSLYLFVFLIARYNTDLIQITLWYGINQLRSMNNFYIFDWLYL